MTESILSSSTFSLTPAIAASIDGFLTDFVGVDIDAVESFNSLGN